MIEAANRNAAHVEAGKAEFLVADLEDLDVSSLPPERFPNLVAVATELTNVDMDARFEFLLEFFVDGLAARAG